MGNNGYLVAVIAVGAVCSTWGIWCSQWPKRYFAPRHDHRRLWVAAFRPEDRWRVEAVLTAICDAFFIPLRYRLYVRPSDEIHEFYRRNMQCSLADSLEYGRLAIDLELGFGICPEVVDSLLSTETCTVGDLVRWVAVPQKVLTVRRSA